jgi:hypothetical protein
MSKYIKGYRVWHIQNGSVTNPVFGKSVIGECGVQIVATSRQSDSTDYDPVCTLCQAGKKMPNFAKPSKTTATAVASTSTSAASVAKKKVTASKQEKASDGSASQK